VIRIGIVGCNFGRLVHLPAFRLDPRCEVIALAGSDAMRTAELAKASEIRLAFGNWEDLVTHPDVDAVTIAAPPNLQPAIAMRALELGKPVFAEKPMATAMADAQAMARAASSSGLAAMIDFNFSAILSWRKAKQLIDRGTIGRLRHVAVNWNVENRSTRMRIKNWKPIGEDGGGALGNFVSHSFHYLEWLCGPIAGLSARLSS
jgi:predicted dehydrogenase